jgi:hypothetical protein
MSPFSAWLRSFRTYLLNHSLLRCRETSVLFQRSALACKKPRGPYFAVMAADLQEPADLIVAFFDELAKDQADVVVGTRMSHGTIPF